MVAPFLPILDYGPPAEPKPRDMEDEAVLEPPASKLSASTSSAASSRQDVHHRTVTITPQDIVQAPTAGQAAPKARVTPDSGAGKAQPRKAPASGRGSAAKKQAQKRTDEEVVEDWQRQRGRAVFAGMLYLLENGCKDEDELRHYTHPMSGDEVLQVAEERALAGKCGNPLCAKPWKYVSPGPRSALQIAGAELEGRSFCSNACEGYVTELSQRLADPAKRLQPSIHELMSKPSHTPLRPGRENVAAQGQGVTTMLATITERDPSKVAAEGQAAGTSLNALAAESSTASKSAKAVDNYVPGQGKANRRAAAAAAVAAAAEPSPSASGPAGAVIAGAGASGLKGGVLVPKGAAEAMEKDRQARAMASAAAEAEMQSEAAAAAAVDPSGSDAEDAGAAGASRGDAAGDSNDNNDNDNNDSAGASAEGASTSSAVARTIGDRTLRSSLKRGSSNARQAAEAAWGEAEAVEKRVTFAPKVEYNTPLASASAAAAGGDDGSSASLLPQEPVLVFSLDAAAGGGEEGPTGCLAVTDASEVVPGEGEEGTDGEEEEEEEAARRRSGADATSLSGQPDQQLPRGMRMWLPASLGGMGVAAKKKQASAGGGGGSNVASNSKSNSGAATASASAAAARRGGGPAPRAAPISADGAAAVNKLVADGVLRASHASASPLPSAPAPTAAAAGSSGAVRRFAPKPQPQRKTVMLASPPGLTPASLRSPATPMPSNGPFAATTTSTNSDTTDTANTIGAVSASHAQPSAPASSPSPSPSGPSRPSPAHPCSARDSARPSEADLFLEGPASAAARLSVAPARARVVTIKSDRPKPPCHVPGGGEHIYCSDDEEGGGGGRGDRKGDEDEEDEQDEEKYNELAFGDAAMCPDEVSDALYAGSLRPGDDPGGYSDSDEGGDGDEYGPEDGSDLSSDDGGGVCDAAGRGGRGGTGRAGKGGGRLTQAEAQASKGSRAGAVLGADAGAGSSRGACATSGCGSQARPAAAAAAASVAPPTTARGASTTTPAKPDQGARDTAKASSSLAAVGTPEQLTEAAVLAAAAAYRDEFDSTDGGSDDDDDTASKADSDQDLNFTQAAPFFARAPRQYRIELTPFNEVQLALGSWVNSRSVDYVISGAIRSQPLSAGDVGQASSSNGSSRRRMKGDDVDGDDDGDGGRDTALDAWDGSVPSSVSMHARGALAMQLDRHLGEVCSALRLRTPLGEISRAMCALLNTLRMDGPLPSFSTGQWHLLVAAVLQALSLHHLPSLRADDAPAADGTTKEGLPQGPGLPRERLATLLGHHGFELWHWATLTDLLTCPEL